MARTTLVVEGRLGGNYAETLGQIEVLVAGFGNVVDFELPVNDATGHTCYRCGLGIEDWENYFTVIGKYGLGESRFYLHGFGCEPCKSVARKRTKASLRLVQ